MGQPAADSAASLPQPLREPGEQVIWADQPDAWHMARGYVLPGWGGVGLLAVVFLVVGLDPLPVILVCAALAAIILLVGAGLVYPTARRTSYVLTNRRALIIRQGDAEAPRIAQEFRAADIGTIQCFGQRGGTGDLLFANAAYRNIRQRSRGAALGFLAVPDVHMVEQHLRAVFPADAAGYDQGAND